jgi:hypothetical protein
VKTLGTEMEGAEMSMATGTRTTPKQTRHSRELEGELGHIRDLVFLRDLFRDRGATADELAEFEDVIAQARTRLATSALDAAHPHVAA